MSRDEIIRLAREADLWMTSEERIAAVERFAALVAAAEREQCARICEGNGDGLDNEPIALRCADAIRSRT